MKAVTSPNQKSVGALLGYVNIALILVAWCLVSPYIYGTLFGRDSFKLEDRLGNELVPISLLAKRDLFSKGFLEVPIDGDYTVNLKAASKRSAEIIANTIEEDKRVPLSRHEKDPVLAVHKIIKVYGQRGINQLALAKAIVAESKRQRYDPLFVAAVIKSESSFNTEATSHVGAKGLMQIMPNTKNYIETFAEFADKPKGSLTTPGYNIKLGIAYLRYLDRMFGDNRVLTLVAYNWGPGHVMQALKGEKRGVPKSVVNYAMRILSDHQAWQS
jgi:hypothetical protein